MRNAMLMLAILTLAPMALGGVQIESEKLASPWAVVAPGGGVISKHATRDMAIEGAANASEAAEGAAYRVVYMQSLRIRHVPRDLPPPAIEPDPAAPALTVQVLDAAGVKLAEHATLAEARADAEARAKASRDEVFAVVVRPIGLREEYRLGPEAPQAVLPPLPAAIDIDALLAGADKTFWVSPAGTGDGLTRQTPASIAALATAQKLNGSTAIRLLPPAAGEAYPPNPFGPWQFNGGLSPDKPVVLCPDDPHGPPIRYDGVVINKPNVVVYGLYAKGTIVRAVKWARIAACNLTGLRFSDTNATWDPDADIAVIGCLLSGSAGSGVFADSGTRGVTLDTCVIDDNGTNERKDHGAYISRVKSFRIVNCWFSRSADTHIKVMAVENMTVEGCVFYGGRSVGSPNCNGSETPTGRNQAVRNLIWRNNVASDAEKGFYAVACNVDSLYEGNVWVRCLGGIYRFVPPPDEPNDMPLTNVTIRDEIAWNCQTFALLRPWQSDAPAGDRRRTGVVFENNRIQGDESAMNRYVVFDKLPPEADPGYAASLDLALSGVEWRANAIWREPDYATGVFPFNTPVRAHPADAAASFWAFDRWTAQTGDTSAIRRVKFTEPRGVPEYAAAHGLTLEQLIDKVRRFEIKTADVHAWIKAGFKEQP